MLALAYHKLDLLSFYPTDSIRLGVCSRVVY
jgi:hypothetical protein